MIESALSQRQRAITCCFTGHRELPASEIEAIKLWLYWTIAELHNKYGVRYFGAGGAVGFDMLAAETVLSMRKAFDVKLIVVVPCRGQSARWSAENKAQYDKILQEADKVVYLAERYYDGCMQRRNRHLVECSAWCVAYQTKNTGGAAYTVGYAESAGINIIKYPQKIFLE